MPRRSAWRRTPGSRIVVEREQFAKRALAIADLIVVAALTGVVWILGIEVTLTWILLAGPATVLLSKMVGLYDRDVHLLIKSTLDEVPKLALVALIMALVILTTLEAGGGTAPGLPTTGAIFLSYLIPACVLRTLGRRIAAHRCGPERFVAVGNPSQVLRLSERIQASQANCQLVGVIPHESPRNLDPRGTAALEVAQAMLDPQGRFRQSRGSTNGKPVTSEDLTGYLSRRNAHRLIIATREASSERIMDLVREAKTLGIRVSLIPEVFEVVESSVEFEQISGTTALGVRSFRLTRSSKLLKRGFDLVISAVATLCLSPVLLIISLAIKLDSPGPVLFRQTRVGRDGRRFQVFKFRTMVADAESRKDELRHLNEASGLFKIENDPRITRVGHFLRRTSLDELPQLLNVIRGEMSLVGPRPMIEEEDGRIQGWHRSRLHLTPGMTGHWQIMGSAKVPLHEMVQIDYLYAANWSIWADVKVLLRTVPHVLGARGQ